jgi:putative membrane protein
MSRHERRRASRLRWSVAGGAAGAAMPVAAAAQERVYEWGWGMHPMWGVWGVGMMLMMLVFWGVVIVGIVLGIRWLVSQGRQPCSDTALEILRQRYARGEIDKQEFDAKKRDLS